MWNIPVPQLLRENELPTINCTISSCWTTNRWLAAASGDVEDMEALTSNDFFRRSTIHCSDVVFNGDSAAIREAFGKHSKFMTKICKRWMKFYVINWRPDLITRKLWATKDNSSIAVGDLVWSCDKQVRHSTTPWEELRRLTLLMIANPDQPFWGITVVFQRDAYSAWFTRKWT